MGMAPAERTFGSSQGVEQHLRGLAAAGVTFGLGKLIGTAITG
jgi:hypothetical protein